jgi:thiol-disulfide isomerase/thioredoxin
MNLGWKHLPRKIKIVRGLNIVGFIIIVVLLAANKDRFQAMLSPESDKIVGLPAPELGAGIWINSDPMTLESLRGKVVVLDFWTFKCRNCVNVLPTLKDWHARYGNRGVVLIGVHSPETDEEANLYALYTFITEQGIAYPVMTDNDFTTWNRYRAQFWPSTFIIDREGVVRKFHFGELGIASLEDDIASLLGKRSLTPD